MTYKSFPNIHIYLNVQEYLNTGNWSNITQKNNQMTHILLNAKVLVKQEC